MKTIIAIITLAICFNATSQMNHFTDLDDIVNMAAEKDTAKLSELGFTNINNVWTNSDTKEYIVFENDGSMTLRYKDHLVYKRKYRATNIGGMILKQMWRGKNNYEEEESIPGLGDALVQYVDKKDKQVSMYVDWNSKLDVVRVKEKTE